MFVVKNFFSNYLLKYVFVFQGNWVHHHVLFCHASNDEIGLRTQFLLKNYLQADALAAATARSSYRENRRHSSSSQNLVNF